MSRPLSVNHNSLVRGSQSNPPSFRTPRANTLVARAVGLDPGDERVARGIRIADVARRADGDIEPAVRAEPNELPAVVRFAGIAVGDDCGFGPRTELRFDIVEAQDAVTSAT